MATESTIAEGKVCTCEPVAKEAKTYYVWSFSNDKRKIPDVVEVHVTKTAIVFQTASHETVLVARNDVFMVTCDICSPPPCS